jgi:hypothetical protein
LIASDDGAYFSDTPSIVVLLARAAAEQRIRRETAPQAAENAVKFA